MENSKKNIQEDKSVSKSYLKQLSNHVSSKLAKKFLMGWANRGPGDMVSLSNREQFILNGIKRDGKVPMTNEGLRKIIREVLEEEHPKVEKWKKSIQAISKQLGVELGEFLGGGVWGIAYEIPGNKALKITEDDREIDNARHLVGKKGNSLVSIYKVYDIKNHDDKKVIIMELVEELIGEKKVLVEEFDRLFEYYSGSNWEPLWPESFQHGWDEDFSVFLGTHDKRLPAIYEELLQIYEEAERHGIHLGDMHPENLGLRNGELVMFDIV